MPRIEDLKELIVQTLKALDGGGYTDSAIAGTMKQKHGFTYSETIQAIKELVAEDVLGVEEISGFDHLHGDWDAELYHLRSK